MGLSRHTNIAAERISRGMTLGASQRRSSCCAYHVDLVAQHRAVTLDPRKRRFTVDLSGIRPRHSKSEFLSSLRADFDATRPSEVGIVHCYQLERTPGPALERHASPAVGIRDEA